VKPVRPGRERVKISHTRTRKAAMSRGYSSVQSGFQLNTTPVIIGAVLVSVGAVIGVTGILIGGSAVLSATRGWLRELEVPPGEVARQKWDQTRAAATAGVAAWQQHNGAPASGARH
jgi:hypothetical protein